MSESVPSLVERVAVHAVRGRGGRVNEVESVTERVVVHAARGRSDQQSQVERVAEKVAVHAARGGSDQDQVSKLEMVTEKCQARRGRYVTGNRAEIAATRVTRVGSGEDGGEERVTTTAVRGVGGGEVERVAKRAVRGRSFLRCEGVGVGVGVVARGSKEGGDPDGQGVTKVRVGNKLIEFL